MQLYLIHSQNAESPLSQEIDLQRWAQEGFYLKTCLRTIWAAPHFPPSLEKAYLEQTHPTHTLLKGAEAYHFLLKLACGLESKLLGETEILGQIKKTWTEMDPALSKKPHSSYEGLIPIFQNLFEDTKEIRAQFLQKIGTESYGGSIRKLLPTLEYKKVLIIGAGQLTSSILPWINHCEITVLNRSPEKAVALKQEFSQISVMDPKEFSQLETHFDTFHHIIVCIPEEDTRDQTWIDQWKKQNFGFFFHLGSHKDFNDTRIFSLKNIFELQKQTQELKSIQIERAKLACVSKTKLRSLPVRSGFGWEDLVDFA